jgi:hypothetical protein
MDAGECDANACMLANAALMHALRQHACISVVFSSLHIHTPGPGVVGGSLACQLVNQLVRFQKRTNSATSIESELSWSRAMSSAVVSVGWSHTLISRRAEASSNRDTAPS